MAIADSNIQNPASGKLRQATSASASKANESTLGKPREGFGPPDMGGDKKATSSGPSLWQRFSPFKKEETDDFIEEKLADRQKIEGHEDADADVTDESLPALRHDVELLEGGYDLDGQPYWQIFDPLQNTYYRLTYSGYCLLSHWKEAEDQKDLIKRVNQRTILEIDVETLTAFINFLSNSGLIVVRTSKERVKLRNLYDKEDFNIFMKIMFRYMMVRKPFLRCDQLLTILEPYVTKFFHSIFFKILFAVVFLLGGYLVSRQWDSYTSTFLYLISIEGVIFSGLGLVCAKLIHESGHAFTAKACGCEVPSIGIALIFFVPVFFTDVNYTWRLHDRRKRLLIAIAGVRAELVLAVFMLFIWSFLPPGPLKSTAFTMSSVTPLFSLIINCNPLFRFDGYYIFQEIVRIDNLQARSRIYSKWWLREKLFGLGVPPVEVVSPGRGLFYVIYNTAIYFYRIGIFIAVAGIVFQYVFKFLGLIMFTMQIGFLVFMPIGMEIITLIKERERFKMNRNLIITLVCFSMFIAFVAIPWKSSISTQAVMEAEKSATIYTPYSGRLSKLHALNGDEVVENQILFEIESDEIDQKLRAIQPQKASINLKLASTVASKELLNVSTVLRESRDKLLQEEAGLREKKEKSIIRTPIDGTLKLNYEDALQEKQWVGANRPIAQVINQSSNKIVTYIKETIIHRIKLGDVGVFYPENILLPSIPVVIKSIDNTSVNYIDLKYSILTESAGGTIPTRVTKEGFAPEQSHYRVILAPTEDAPHIDSQYLLKGKLSVKGESESFAESVRKNITRVFIRESGF